MTGFSKRQAADGLRWVMNAVLPPQCLACGAIVDAPGRLCGPCWQAVDFIDAPQCAACGLPFELPLGPAALCGECNAQRPPFGRARAAMRYGGVARQLVLSFKHGDRTDAAPGLARWLVQAGGVLTREADIYVPVPLHRWRLARRRFNQAALLAQALGRTTARPVLPDAIWRVRATGSQGGQGRQARIRNVRGAFRLNPKASERLRDARALLVDDVYTTGATVTECAWVLLRGGARRVDVLTLARVVREGSDPITAF